MQRLRDPVVGTSAKPGEEPARSAGTGGFSALEAVFSPKCRGFGRFAAPAGASAVAPRTASATKALLTGTPPNADDPSSNHRAP
jgi:hypothetical protein